MFCLVVSGPDSGVVFAAASAVRDLWLAGHCEMQVRLTAGLIMLGLSTQCSSSTGRRRRGDCLGPAGAAAVTDKHTPRLDPLGS